MFKSKRLLFSMIGVLVITVIASSIFALKGNSQAANTNKQSAKVLRKQTENKKQSPNDKELDDSATPIADYDANNTINNPAEQKLREEKNARYNGYFLVSSERNRNAAEVQMPGGDESSDLPYADSDAVVEGKVINSAAYLSADKNAVYSEFTVDVKDILKNTNDNKLKKNESIVVDRLGGRVRHSDGQIVRYKVSGQGSPLVESKYLLFLKKNPSGDYRIITGYEMKGNKVFALDGSRINFGGQGKFNFDNHNNKDINKFKEDFEKAKKEPSSNKAVKGEG